MLSMCVGKCDTWKFLFTVTMKHATPIYLFIKTKTSLYFRENSLTPGTLLRWVLVLRSFDAIYTSVVCWILRNSSICSAAFQCFIMNPFPLRTPLTRKGLASVSWQWADKQRGRRLCILLMWQAKNPGFSVLYSRCLRTAVSGFSRSLCIPQWCHKGLCQIYQTERLRYRLEACVVTARKVNQSLSKSSWYFVSGLPQRMCY